MSFETFALLVGTFGGLTGLAAWIREKLGIKNSDSIMDD